MSNGVVITQEILKVNLSYDEINGTFVRRRSHHGRRAGTVAGSLSKNGYIHLHVNGKKYLAHRLAWLYVTGEFPKNDIDHRDGNRSNNAINNLRAATRSENFENLSRKSSNTSGFIGVTFCKQTRRWRAEISASKVKYDLGRHDTPELAGMAYLAAKKEKHKFQPTPRTAATSE